MKKNNEAKSLLTDIRDEDCYDHSKVYKEEIEPHVEAIKQICMYRRMPMFISIAVANNKKATEYKNDAVFAFAKRHLFDNRINKMLLALNGFKFDLPDDIKTAVYKVLDYCDNVTSVAQGNCLEDLHLSDNIMDMINLICQGASIIQPDHQNDDFADEDRDLIIPKVYDDDGIGED